jgi:DNA uptake protein ComE-like DNA-binding protein
MSIRSDHKALMFIGAVGVLGASVRVVRAASREQAPAAQPALERQRQAADSAAAAQRKSKGDGRSGRGRGGEAASTRDAGGRRAGSRDSAASPGSRAQKGPLDRPGYVGARLDLDVATAAQIDSLPGVSSLMARRIAVDRVKRGPFLGLSGLRRVSGAGNGFLAKIDTLVAFSGTFAVALPGDTLIPSKRKRK